MVAVDCMSRYLRVQPLKSKCVSSSAESVKQMIKTKERQKVWVDKGTEFKGSFKNYVRKRASKHTKQRVKKSSLSPRGRFDY